MVNDYIKTMMADVLASYEYGVKGITPIFSAATMLLDPNDEQETGRIQIRETLARNGNLRKADFDRMLAAVTQPGNNRGKERRLLLLKFLVSQQKMIEQLCDHFARIRAYIETDDVENIRRVFTRIKKIITRQEQARQDLEPELAKQDEEEQEIQTGIKSLLQKGRELQICDFKEMLDGIKHQSKSRIEQSRLRQEAVSQMLAGYKEQRLKSEITRRSQCVLQTR